jgi:hypothetical protein
MLSVIGCENETVLTITEISALACWKAAHKRQGTLSIPNLVDHRWSIDAECLQWATTMQQQQPHTLPPGSVFYPVGGADNLTGKIFRAMVWVYLHSVLLGEGGRTHGAPRSGRACRRRLTACSWHRQVRAGRA